VIWDGEEAKQRVLQSQKQKAEYAGWVPSTNSRTASQFLQQRKIPSFLLNINRNEAY
jgi:hypothetical protein